MPAILSRFALDPASKLYQLLQCIIFPLFMFGPPIIAHQLISAGWSLAPVVYSCIVVLMLLMLVFEQLLPYRPEWNQADDDVLNDVSNVVISYGLLPLLIKPLFGLLMVGVGAYLAATLGFELWPDHWPMWAQVALGLLAVDAGRYWGHRLCHELPWLWRFHAVHHSPHRLWFFNAMRQHPVDKTVFQFSEMLFPVMLGASAEVFGLLLIMTACNGYFQHTNMNVRLGPFYYLFNTVDLHRWHHSKFESESNHNYGNNLIIYDFIFGSFYKPAGRQVGEIGLVNRQYPKTYLGQLMAPFRRGKLDKQSLD